MEIASGESKIVTKGKLSGNKWCRTNDGKNCDGNVYNAEVMRKSSPATLLDAVRDMPELLQDERGIYPQFQSFIKEHGSKYIFNRNTEFL